MDSQSGRSDRVEEVVDNSVLGGTAFLRDAEI